MAPVSFSVVWSVDAGPQQAGRLDLGEDALSLSGGSRQAPKELELPFKAIDSVRVARGANERLARRSTVVLDLRDGRALSIAGLATVGLSELIELLQIAVAAA